MGGAFAMNVRPVSGRPRIVPQIGDVFVIMTCDLGTGAVDHLTGVSAGSGNVSRVQDHPTGVTLSVDAPVPPDLDADGDVDPDDLGILNSCKTRDRVPHDGTAMCQAADLDHDGDVDLNDFGRFQRCFSGTNVPADPACAQ